MTRHDWDDPELAEIEELRGLERGRTGNDRALRRRSNALILSVVLILAALGTGAAWIAGVL